jgi:hypothetical protein
MTPSPHLAARLQNIRRVALIGAAAGSALCAAGFWMLPEEFFPAYLTAYIYCLGLSLGTMGVAMLHGITGGAWGRAIRRVVEAGYETLPLMALLFIPLWLGVGRIYEWADPEAVAQHAALARKAAYLNVTGYHLRAVIYFAVWIGTAWMLNLNSPGDERAADSPRRRRLQATSGLGLIAYGFTFTLAAVDWVMSLEPEWYSTMYGLIHIVGQGVSGLALALVVVLALADFEPWSRIVTPERLVDLGNLLLASVMFWAYTSFFQYLVIWSGNLPEENSWYVRRSDGGWQYLALGLAALHFAVPFLLLLSRRLKQQGIGLFRIAALLLAMRYCDLFWMVVPGFQRESGNRQGLAFHWLDVAALAAIGGLWLSFFTWRLSARIRLPLYDPEFAESIDERNGRTAPT